MILPEPAYSFADNWTSILYTPDEIKSAIISVRGMHVCPQPNRLGNWEACWREGERYIAIDVLECDIDADNESRPGINVYWGGSLLRTHCFLADILFVWNSIRRICPAVWMHNTDCRLYSPASFTREIDEFFS